MTTHEEVSASDASIFPEGIVELSIINENGVKTQNKVYIQYNNDNIVQCCLLDEKNQPVYDNILKSLNIGLLELTISRNAQNIARLLTFRDLSDGTVLEFNCSSNQFKSLLMKSITSIKTTLQEQGRVPLIKSSSASNSMKLGLLSNSINLNTQTLRVNSNRKIDQSSSISVNNKRPIRDNSRKSDDNDTFQLIDKTDESNYVESIPHVATNVIYSSSSEEDSTTLELLRRRSVRILDPKQNTVTEPDHSVSEPTLTKAPRSDRSPRREILSSNWGKELKQQRPSLIASTTLDTRQFTKQAMSASQLLFATMDQDPSLKNLVLGESRTDVRSNVSPTRQRIEISAKPAPIIPPTPLKLMKRKTVGIPLDGSHKEKPKPKIPNHELVDEKSGLRPEWIPTNYGNNKVASSNRFTPPRRLSDTRSSLSGHDSPRLDSNDDSRRPSRRDSEEHHTRDVLLGEDYHDTMNGQIIDESEYDEKYQTLRGQSYRGESDGPYEYSPQSSQSNSPYRSSNGTKSDIKQPRLNEAARKRSLHVADRYDISNRRESPKIRTRANTTYYDPRRKPSQSISRDISPRSDTSDLTIDSPLNRSHRRDSEGIDGKLNLDNDKAENQSNDPNESIYAERIEYDPDEPVMRSSLMNDKSKVTFKSKQSNSKIPTVNRNNPRQSTPQRQNKGRETTPRKSPGSVRSNQVPSSKSAPSKLESNQTGKKKSTMDMMTDRKSLLASNTPKRSTVSPGRPMISDSSTNHGKDPKHVEPWSRGRDRFDSRSSTPAGEQLKRSSSNQRSSQFSSSNDLSYNVSDRPQSRSRDRTPQQSSFLEVLERKGRNPSPGGFGTRSSRYINEEKDFLSDDDPIDRHHRTHKSAHLRYEGIDEIVRQELANFEARIARRLSASTPILEERSPTPKSRQSISKVPNNFAANSTRRRLKGQEGIEVDDELSTEAAEWHRLTHWLHNIQMGKYSKIFRSHGITKLSVVELLQQEDLEDIMADGNDIRVLLKHIQQLSNQTRYLSEQALSDSSSDQRRYHMKDGASMDSPGTPLSSKSMANMLSKRLEDSIFKVFSSTDNRGLRLSYRDSNSDSHQPSKYRSSSYDSVGSRTIDSSNLDMIGEVNPPIDSLILHQSYENEKMYSNESTGLRPNDKVISVGNQPRKSSLSRSLPSGSQSVPNALHEDQITAISSSHDHLTHEEENISHERKFAHTYPKTRYDTDNDVTRERDNIVIDPLAIEEKSLPLDYSSIYPENEDILLSGADSSVQQSETDMEPMPGISPSATLTMNSNENSSEEIKNNPISPKPSTISYSLIDLLLQSFDDGNDEKFYHLWCDHEDLSSGLISSSKLSINYELVYEKHCSNDALFQNILIIEYYCALGFLIHSINSYSESTSFGRSSPSNEHHPIYRTKSNLKHFIEELTNYQQYCQDTKNDNRPIELLNLNDFGVYSGIIFVINPKENPNFLHLFKSEWRESLKLRLQGFLNVVLSLSSPLTKSKSLRRASPVQAAVMQYNLQSLSRTNSMRITPSDGQTSPRPSLTNLLLSTQRSGSVSNPLSYKTPQSDQGPQNISHNNTTPSISSSIAKVFPMANINDEIDNATTETKEGSDSADNGITQKKLVFKPLSQLKLTSTSLPAAKGNRKRSSGIQSDPNSPVMESLGGRPAFPLKTVSGDRNDKVLEESKSPNTTAHDKNLSTMLPIKLTARPIAPFPHQRGHPMNVSALPSATISHSVRPAINHVILPSRAKTDPMNLEMDLPDLYVPRKNSRFLESISVPKLIDAPSPDLVNTNILVAIDEFNKGMTVAVESVSKSSNPSEVKTETYDQTPSNDANHSNVSSSRHTTAKSPPMQKKPKSMKDQVAEYKKHLKAKASEKKDRRRRRP